MSFGAVLKIPNEKTHCSGRMNKKDWRRETNQRREAGTVTQHEDLRRTDGENSHIKNSRQKHHRI
jgi:hypothetical protein